MKFIFQFKPESKLSFLSIGFLIFPFYSESLGKFSLFLFTFFLFCTFFLCGYRKLTAIVLGILLGFFNFLYSQKDISHLQITKEVFGAIHPNQFVELSLEKEIKKNFYITKIKFEKKEYQAVVKRTKKDSLLPTFYCNSQNIQIKQIPEKEEYFRFLEEFHFYYLQILEKKCNLIHFELDQRKVFKQQTEDILFRAGLTDYANDIAMGLFLGDASYLENEFKQKVKEGGILHLFAASGLHIGVFIGFLFFFANRIPFFNYYTERIFPLLFAFLYLYLLNFPVSLLRAYIFASLFILGSLFFRKMKSVDLLLVSAAILLFIDRENFLTLSFNLSYSAVCGILFFKKYLDDLFFGKMKNFFTENFSISISASLGTYPILIFYFKSFSFGSIFLNLILVPLTSLLLPLLYISLFFKFIQEQFVSLFQPINQDLNFFFHIISIFLTFITEILFAYSELLLRSLAYLSDNLSTSLGFFRTVFQSYYFHLSFYCIFLLIIILCFFLVEIDFFQNERAKIRKLRFSFSVFAFLTLIGFFYFGYILYPDEKKIKSFQDISAGSDYYLVREENKIYLGGICKYSEFKIQKLLKEKFCDSSTESIFIEEETCLSLAILCKSQTVNAKIFTKKKLMEWEKAYSFLSQDELASKRNFKELVVFYPHLDSLYDLQKYTKKENGKVLLLFAYKLNDNPKDWNANKNLLGINPNWIFITPDEL